MSLLNKVNSARGAGIKVAVVDSGIDVDHPFLADANIAGGASFHPSPAGGVRQGPFIRRDAYGHGTACAGIIFSIAPEASIYSVSVLDARLKSSTECVKEAVTWCARNDIKVVNLSLGTTNEMHQRSYSILAHAAYYRDLILVSANVNSPERSYPARLASVIGVRAKAMKNNDLVEMGYARNNEIEFLAQGIQVRVPWLDGGFMYQTGNSFAAPHVTGLVCRIVEAFPGCSPFEVKAILKQYCQAAEPVPKAVSGQAQ